MAPGRGARRSDERLRRLLVMLPWLAQRGTVSTAEMAERFGLSVRMLVTDLEQAAMCGLPPYTDELLDIIVDEDEVSLGIPRLFLKPLRLTAPEGVALVAAARAALELPGAEPDGPLARAVAKLEAVVGIASVEVDLGAPEFVAELASAVDAAAVLRVGYWAASTGERTTRLVEPQKVFHDRGHWYLLAHDRGVGEQRVFRIDRVEEVERTGEFGQPSASVAVPEWFDGAVDVVSVRLRLAPAASWVTERFPVETVALADDGSPGVEVVLKVTSERWLARLLVRLGPDAVVLEPPEWADLAARTARTVLDRYA